MLQENVSGIRGFRCLFKSSKAANMTLGSGQSLWHSQMILKLQRGRTEESEVQEHLRRGRKDRAFGDWHEIPMVSRRHGWEEVEIGAAVAPDVCRGAMEYWDRHPWCITELWKLASQSGRLWPSKAWLFNNTDLPGVLYCLWLISKDHLSAFSEALRDLEHYGTSSMSC